MNFRPTEVFFKKNADGTKTRIEQWSYDTLAGYELTGQLIHLMWLIFLAFLIGPFFLIFTLLMYNGRFNFLNVIGAFASSYILLDAYNGWILITGMNILFHEQVLNIIIILNILSLMIHLFLIFFGTITHKLIVGNIQNIQARYTLFSWLIFIIILFTFNQTKDIVYENNGWVENHIKRNIETINNEQQRLDDIEHERIMNGGDYYDVTDKGDVKVMDSLVIDEGGDYLEAQNIESFR